MVWLFLVGGVVVGGAIWGWSGALSLGFLGWLVGVVVKSQRTPQVPPVDPVNVRLQRVEQAVARIEGRLARLEAGEVPAALPPAPTVVTAPAPPAPESVSALPAQESPSPSKEGGEGLEELPSPPAKPNPVVAWLTGGNAIARVGLLILFVGLAFLIKYAADRDMVPIEWRVGGVASVGMVLLGLGWRLRERRSGFALGLQGGGVAVLYLTTFAALRLYGLISPQLAFVLLAAIAALSAFLAVKQDAMVLAAFGAGGGFLAPILASTGGGSHVMLFSYYLLLNLGIAAIAVFKSWRALNITGFLFTFVIGLAWGLKYYQPAYFGTTAPFLGAFFLLYVAITLLYARGRPPRLGDPVDGTLVFGVPLAAFALQAALTRDTEFGLAWSAVGASAFYLGLALVLRRRREENWRLLVECFLALGVAFATLAIPLALDARWTSAAWALEGAAIVWVGIRQRRRVARACGLLLQVAAGVAFLEAYSRLPARMPWIDAVFVGAVLLSAAGLWTSRLLAAAGERVAPWERRLAPGAFLWGLGWWLFAGHHDIESFVSGAYDLNAHIAFFAATAWAFSWFSLRKDWKEAAWPALVLLPVLFASLLAAFAALSHPFARFGGLAWILALVVQAWTLRRHADEARAGYLEFLHGGTLLLVAAVGAIEVHWWVEAFTARESAWALAAVLVVPAVLMILVSSRAMDARWPVAGHAAAYRLSAAVLLAGAMLAWTLYANVEHDGRSDPLPYLPLLNGVDLGHMLVAFTLWSVVRSWRRTGLEPPAVLRGPALMAVAGAFAFVWLNGILLRTWHHWAGIPYELDAMSESVRVQASLSLSWSLLALALMVFATRSARRALWLTGAVLMGVVVLKLFVVDLSDVGGIARIVSFIGVGVLMLVIGYFAPVPPRGAEPRS